MCSAFTRPVTVRKSRTAVVMLASGAPMSCRRRISAAAFLVPGIVWIDVHRHSVIYPGLADGWGLMESGANNIG